MASLNESYTLVDGSSQIDADAAHAFLSQTYWSQDIPLETVQRAIANSICVAVQCEGEQVAMARVVTDRATFGYLADVYVLEEHRGKGLSSAMLDRLHNHPELQGLRRWMLMTLDAHGLYKQFGWEPLEKPELAMELFNPSVYQ